MNNWIVDKLREAGINPSFVPSNGVLKHATEDVFNGEKHIIFCVDCTMFYVNVENKTYTTAIVGKWEESEPVYCGVN